MRMLGFDDAQQTAGGSDGGIDVISQAHRVAAQVKHYSGLVGRPDLQKLAGAASQFSERVFYARSGYTAAAREYAEDHDIALFTYDPSGFISPTNSRAVELNSQMSADFQLERIRKREHEMAMAEHLRFNPPWSAWTYERYRQCWTVLLRLYALEQVWPALCQQLRDRYGTSSESLLVWLNDERDALLRLMDERDASEYAVPRDWARELQRLEDMRGRTSRLETQWGIYLDGSTNVRSLLNAASTLILEEQPDFREAGPDDFEVGPVDPIATQADWENLWRTRAKTLIRYQGVVEGMQEIDRRAAYNPQWRAVSAAGRDVLSEVAIRLDVPTGWTGPEHFNVRYKRVGTASRTLGAAEYKIAEFWGPAMKVRKIIDRHANAWAALNRRRSDVEPLLASGFQSVPLP